MVQKVFSINNINITPKTSVKSLGVELDDKQIFDITVLSISTKTANQLDVFERIDNLLEQFFLFI